MSHEETPNPQITPEEETASAAACFGCAVLGFIFLVAFLYTIAAIQ